MMEVKTKRFIVSNKANHAILVSRDQTQWPLPLMNIGKIHSTTLTESDVEEGAPDIVIVDEHADDDLDIEM